MTKHFNKVIDVTIKTLLITGDTLKFCVQKRKKLIIMFMQARTCTYTYTHIYTHTFTHIHPQATDGQSQTWL